MIEILVHTSIIEVLLIHHIHATPWHMSYNVTWHMSMAYRFSRERERERKKEKAIGFGQFTLFNLSGERFVPIPNLNLSGKNLS